MKHIAKAALMVAMGILLPVISQAQSLSGSIGGLQSVLDQLYDQMMPLCSQLIGVGRALAGFAACWYIGYRVWRHIANAEPVDLFPLFRPFVIGFAVLIFPSVLGLINGVLQPTVKATSGMVNNSDEAIALLLKEKEAAIEKTDAWKMYVGESGSGDKDKWYQYTHPDNPNGGTGLFASIGNDIKFAMDKASYNFRNSIKEWLSEILQVLYEAAALCIDTIRTFYLIVLAILGPIVFGLAVFDGLQHTLTVWLARYINVFLWLPVANIFGAMTGKIQEQMLKIDISQVQVTGDTFFSSTDTAYLIFMIIAIIGYFTVPSVANYIVYAGGGNTLLNKVSSFGGGTAKTMVNAASGGTGMVADALGNGAEKVRNSMTSFGTDAGYFKDKIKGPSS